MVVRSHREKTFTRLIDQVDPRDKTRILEQQNGIGGSFMAATPNRHAQTKISSDQYRLGLRWWLGLSLFPEGTDPEELKCSGCNVQVDVFGDHLLCCKNRNNNFYRRHNAVRDAIVSVLLEAGQSFAVEVMVPNQPEDSSLRPADILLKGWTAGKDTALDLTICHGWQLAEQGTTRERWRTF